MRINTACFESFKAYIEKDLNYITDKTYTLVEDNSICWFSHKLAEQADTFSAAWNAAARFYKSFK